ncbi:MAG: DUF6498-containing protein [Candidatus Diapherotrites archaeon]
MNVNLSNFKDISFYPSAIVLIIFNLIPLFGVLFYGWNTTEILLLYWSESAIIGFYTILKMLLAKGAINLQNLQQADGKPVIKINLAGATPEETAEKKSFIIKIFLVVFFCIHYGIFMAAHLFAILFLVIFRAFFSFFFNLRASIHGFETIFFNVLIAFVFLFISHGISFITNYVGRKEYEKASPTTLMFSPYPRIIVMQAALIFGAIISAPVLILVIGKIVLDLYAHISERKRFQTN